MRGHASTRKGGPSHGAGQVFFTTNLTSKHQVSREIRNLRTSLPSSSSGNRDYTVWISRKCKTLLPSSPVKRRFESRKSRMSNRQCLPMSFRRVVTTGTLTETEMERRGRGEGRVRHGLITNRYNRILCRCLDRRIKNPSKYYRVLRADSSCSISYSPVSSSWKKNWVSGPRFEGKIFISTAGARLLSRNFLPSPSSFVSALSLPRNNGTENRERSRCPRNSLSPLVNFLLVTIIRAESRARDRLLLTAILCTPRYQTSNGGNAFQQNASPARKIAETDYYKATSNFNRKRLY